MKNKKHCYQKAFLWHLLSLLISTSNDAITKHLAFSSMPPEQITFYRLVLGLVVLIIYRLKGETSTFRTAYLRIHIVRGAFFFIASWLWSYGLSKASVASATTIGFTIPLFVLAFAPILLKEQVSWQLWLATCIGFLASMIMIFDPTNLAVHASSWQPNIHLVALFIATLLFALLDIINKKYIAKESMLSMLFYSHLMASVCSLPFIHFPSALPSFSQQIPLLLLGLGSVSILYCLLKAYMYASASLLAPSRYVEIPIACMIDYVCFNQLPGLNCLIGASLIIPASLFVALQQDQV